MGAARGSREFGLHLDRRPFQAVAPIIPQMSLPCKPGGTRNCRRCRGGEHAGTLIAEGLGVARGTRLTIHSGKTQQEREEVRGIAAASRSSASECARKPDTKDPTA